MFLPDRRWDEDDARYVRNAVLIGCAIALFTEVVRGAVDLAKSRVEKHAADLHVELVRSEVERMKPRPPESCAELDDGDWLTVERPEDNDEETAP